MTKLMTKLSELERRLSGRDPRELARVRQEVREAGLVHVDRALDRIADRTTR